MAERFYRREELVGKEVYDTKAMHIGAAKDVAYSKDGKPALIVTKGNREEIIPFQDISEIGEIILVKRTLMETTATLPPPKREERIAAVQGPSAEPSKTCPKCGMGNRPTAKFCVKCGFKFT